MAVANERRRCRLTSESDEFCQQAGELADAATCNQATVALRRLQKISRLECDYSHRSWKYKHQPPRLGLLVLY